MWTVYKWLRIGSTGRGVPVVNTVMTLRSYKRWKFLDQLSDCQLLEKDRAHCRSFSLMAMLEVMCVHIILFSQYFTDFCFEILNIMYFLFIILYILKGCKTYGRCNIVFEIKGW
jgi:hypothetical protein